MYVIPPCSKRRFEQKRKLFTNNFTFYPAKNEIHDADDQSFTHPSSDDDCFSHNTSYNHPLSDNMDEKAVYNNDDTQSLGLENPYDFIQEPDEYDEWEYYHG